MWLGEEFQNTFVFIKSSKHMLYLTLYINLEIVQIFEHIIELVINVPTCYGHEAVCSLHVHASSPVTHQNHKFYCTYT